MNTCVTGIYTKRMRESLKYPKWQEILIYTFNHPEYIRKEGIPAKYYHEICHQYYLSLLLRKMRNEGYIIIHRINSKSYEVKLTDKGFQLAKTIIINGALDDKHFHKQSAIKRTEKTYEKENDKNGQDRK